MSSMINDKFTRAGESESFLLVYISGTLGDGEPLWKLEKIQGLLGCLTKVHVY